VERKLQQFLGCRKWFELYLLQSRLLPLESSTGELSFVRLSLGQFEEQLGRILREDSPLSNGYGTMGRGREAIDVAKGEEEDDDYTNGMVNFD
jgi:hypothetical protein